ncbi:ABC transporter ATP-binding protein [Haloprofundus salilacus]|uniref:ABC transporter ATP-binding protein n=1 Tax=Haloprofundus salilacus TaxID=2876190 RepID=UPI001CCB0370|nr:ABC transporter ATP-binding protein [Haloprofundus salilacus]
MSEASGPNEATDETETTDEMTDTTTQSTATEQQPTETHDAGTTASDAAEYPLRVENLRKTFGGIVAVDDASFEVERGTLTGLIGPNGAGKSTTFNLITGMYTPDAGRVVFNGEEITGLPPYRVADRGLVRTFQIARELSEMTVLENMMLAPKQQRGEALWRSVTPGVRNDVVRQEEELLDRAWEMLDFFEIDHLAEEYAGNLSGGQRKLLEMARALLTDPDMLLLDEPFAGVNPSLERRLLEHVHELREQGYTFLLVEHDMDLIMENCEHVIVMHQGRVLTEGTPADIKQNKQVVEAYLGGNV